jgi:hypothetical protein
LRIFPHQGIVGKPGIARCIAHYKQILLLDGVGTEGNVARGFRQRPAEA